MGAYSLTLTATEITDVTLPASGTLATTDNITTHAAVQTGIHGLAITAGKTLTVQDDVTITGALGTAAYTATGDYEASGATATHAALKTGIHGVTIADSFATSGAYALTLTATEATNVTLPASGTLMANPMTTAGDVIYGAASGVATRLAKGTDDQVLTLASGIRHGKMRVAAL